MTDKAKEAAAYSAETTRACETLLVLLLRVFGDQRSSLRLIGGLVPRYLAPESPPDVPAHVGSTDVDVVLDVAVLDATGALGDLKTKLKQAGFARFQNTRGGESRWQWEREIDGCWMRVDFLASTDDLAGFKVIPIGDGSLSAGGLPFAAMARDWYAEQPVTVELPEGGGTATEVVRHADAAAFIALKALALKGRDEPKDVADIVHVLRYYRGSPQSLAATFAERLNGGEYNEALRTALAQLDLHFCGDGATEGYLKDGPTRFVDFHDLADGDERVLEQRNVSGLVNAFLALVENSGAWTRPGRAAT